MPKNEFGNVYLFKPSMLPIGAAHVKCKPYLNERAMVVVSFLQPFDGAFLAQIRTLSP